MEKFHKLLKKKMDEGKELNPIDKDAKMGVLKDLHKMASDSMADKLHGIKKVTVAAPDEEGLKHGLEKAQDIVSDMPEMLEESEDGHPEGEELEESAEHELSESPEEEASEHDELGEMDEADIDAQLADLMKKKQLLQMKKA